MLSISTDESWMQLKIKEENESYYYCLEWEYKSSVLIK